MKRLLVLGLCVLLAGCASLGPAPSNRYEKIIDHGKLAEEYFDLTMLWMNEHFVSAKNVIQYSDKSSGIITGKAEMAGKTGIISYTLTIEIKDNRTRMTFKADYGSTWGGSNATMGNYEIFTSNAEYMADSLAEYVATAKTDW